jgi:DNA-binding transcriptional regulator YhcF (GntR family)
MSPLPDGLEVRVDRASDLPLGVQLARALRDWIGRSAPGARLPSVRELAASAGVNVNTARAVYQRLESEGLLRSEQGRGTFVSSSRGEGRGQAAARAELRRQIALLEGELARRPPIPSDPFKPAPAQPARLMTTDDLREVRDELVARLRTLDAARAEVLERLAELEAEDRIALAQGEGATDEDRDTRRSTLSVPGARVRWVGA